MPWNFSDMYGRQKVVDANVFPVMVPIFDTILSSAQATIDIQNIPQTYAHLRLVFAARTDNAVTSQSSIIRINNDSGSNYADQIVKGAATTASAIEDNSVTSGFSGYTAGASATAGHVGVSAIDFPNYAGTTFFKSWTGTNFVSANILTGGRFETAIGAVWASTAAINRITLLPAAGNWVAGTRATLYGIGVIAPASPGSVLPVQYGTTLPASPLDGQEAILVDNTSTPTYSWRFRYNANSANTDKWEFVGGTPLESSVNDATLESLASSAGYVDFTTNVSLVAPRAGQYIIEFGGTFVPPAGPGNDLYVAPNYGSGASDNDALFVTMQATSAAEYGTFAKSAGRKTIAAGATVKLQYRTNTGIGNSRRSKYVRIIPVRVS